MQTTVADDSVDVVIYNATGQNGSARPGFIYSSPVKQRKTSHVLGCAAVSSLKLDESAGDLPPVCDPPEPVKDSEVASDRAAKVQRMLGSADVKAKTEMPMAKKRNKSSVSAASVGRTASGAPASKLPPSKFRGITRHRTTGRYEAHLWDPTAERTSTSPNARKRGKQVMSNLIPLLA
jgi:hypothetical protein